MEPEQHDTSLSIDGVLLLLAIILLAAGIKLTCRNHHREVELPDMVSTY